MSSAAALPMADTLAPLARPLPALFWLMTAALIAVGKAGLLEYLFPVAALAVGTVLYLEHTPRYLSFTWWLWFLTPEVRRLIDHQSGYSTISPVMLTPFLVGGLTLLTVLAYAPLLRHRAWVGFVLVVAGLGYAYVVGIAAAGPAPATFGLLNWLIPVTLGLHVAFHWPLYPAVRDEVVRTFVSGMIAVGGYGLLQYFIMPAWDAHWLINVGMTNQGLPLPFQVRVFSTLNSSGPLAFCLLTGILVLVVARGPLVPVAGLAALGALMLSLVRAAWLVAGVSLLYLLATLPPSGKARLLLIGGVLALAAGPLLGVPQIGRAIESRLDTFQTMENDASYQERQEFYGRFLIQAFSNVRGAGIGTIDTATKLANDDGALGAAAYFDSGIMRVPYELGWPGSIAYIAGIGLLLAHAFGGKGADSRCWESIVLAMLVALVFELTLVKVTGVSFWFFLGLALAARDHQRQTRDTSIRWSTP